MKIKFEVIGIPKPQARPRVFLNKGRVFAHSPKTSYFESVKAKAYEARITANKQLSGALDLSLIFLLPYPKSMSQKKKREKHYKYYTDRAWKNPNNYDLMLNVDLLGVEKCAELIENIIKSK